MGCLILRNAWLDPEELIHALFFFPFEQTDYSFLCLYQHRKEAGKFTQELQLKIFAPQMPGLNFKHDFVFCKLVSPSSPFLAERVSALFCFLSMPVVPYEVNTCTASPEGGLLPLGPPSGGGAPLTVPTRGGWHSQSFANHSDEVFHH